MISKKEEEELRLAREAKEELDTSAQEQYEDEQSRHQHQPDEPEVQFVDASEIASYLSQRYRELEDGPEKSTVAAGLMTFWCGAEVNHVSLFLEGARASIQMIPDVKPQRMN